MYSACMREEGEWCSAYKSKHLDQIFTIREIREQIQRGYDTITTPRSGGETGYKFWNMQKTDK